MPNFNIFSLNAVIKKLKVNIKANIQVILRGFSNTQRQRYNLLLNWIDTTPVVY